MRKKPADFGWTQHIVFFRFPKHENRRIPPPVFRFFVMDLRYYVQGEMFPSHPVRIVSARSGDTLDGIAAILCLQVLTSGPVRDCFFAVRE